MSNLAGRILNFLKESKGMKTAKDEMSEAIWEWIRPIFLVDDEEAKSLKDFKDNPNDKLNQNAITIDIEKYLRDNPSQKAELIKILDMESDSGTGKTVKQTHYGEGDNIAGDKVTYNK